MAASRFFDVSTVNQLCYCLNSFSLEDPDATSNKIYEKYYTKEFGLNKGEILKFLRNQLDDVIKLLRFYFQKYFQKNVKPISQAADITPSYVISFNYTNTYKIYGIKPEDVFHVHGNLEKGNMVLGFNDDKPKNLDFVYFKKYFQRIQKRTGYMEESRFHLVENEYSHTEIPVVTHFFGHSMDITDKDIIKKLNDLSSRFVIYYRDQEDFEKKVINLIKIFGKKGATKDIQNGKFEYVECEEHK